MYRWWVFVHLVGVFGFLVAHGVSVSVTFRLRKERDPRRVTELLALSGSSIRAFYASTFVLLLGGAVAGFLGHWWSQGWIWASLGVLVVTSLAMVFMARPFYRRVGFVARSMAGGSKAVSAAQFDTILGSRRPWTIAAIGFVGLLLILYLMLFKPTLGFGSSPVSPQPVVTGSPAVTLRISAKGVAFSTSSLSAPASLRFDIAFANQDPGIPHDVAIYTNPSAATLLFRGTTFPGVRTVTYRIPPLPPGTYFFRCDVHPAQMTGTIVVK